KHIAQIFDIKGDKEVISYFDRDTKKLMFSTITKEGSFSENGKIIGQQNFTLKEDFVFTGCTQADKDGYHYMLMMNSDYNENARLDLVQCKFDDLSLSKSPIKKYMFLNPPVFGDISTNYKSSPMIGMEHFIPNNSELRFNDRGNLVWYFHIYTGFWSGTDKKFEYNGRIYLAEMTTKGKLISFRELTRLEREKVEEKARYNSPVTKRYYYAKHIYSKYIGHNTYATLCLYNSDINSKDQPLELHLYLTDLNTGEMVDRYRFYLSKEMLEKIMKEKTTTSGANRYHGPFIESANVFLHSASEGYLFLPLEYSFYTERSPHSAKRRSGAFIIPFSRN
ncbi:MAG: hypothetical protein MK212_06495, partial [Saprospiraceae bacterium]|nr:hypothetical protein [Saprospiraceae bacterium]